MISGTRKPPPISTSSPRDTTTSRPRASDAEREQHRGRVVVDDDPGFGAARAGEQPPDMLVAGSARVRSLMRYSRFEYDGGDIDRVGERAGAERRPAEVGVQQHAGRVHDPTQCARPQLVDPRRCVGDDVGERDVDAAIDIGTRRVDRFTRAVDEQRVREPGERIGDSVPPRAANGAGPSHGSVEPARDGPVRTYNEKVQHPGARSTRRR